MKAAQYLDAAKKRLNLPSDYALAKRLGVSTSRFGNWRSGRSLPDTGICIKLAEILELDELRVIADVELERGTNDELWKRIARRVALVACAVVGVQAPAPAPAEAATLHNVNSEYTLRGIRRQRGRAAWSFAALVARLALVSL